MFLVKQRIFSKNALFMDSFSIVLCVVIGFFFSFYIAPISRDFENYEEYYKSLSALYESAGSRFEFGFDFVARGLSKFFPKYPVAMYLCLIPTSLFVKCYILRKLSKNDYSLVLLMLFAYLLSFGILLELNQLRAAVAISLGYLSLLLLADKKNVAAVFAFFLAFSMHYSSVIFLLGCLSVFLVHKNKMRLLFILITSFCIISKSAVIIIENLNPIAAEYSKNYDQASFGFTSATLLLAIVYFIFHFYHIKKESKINASLIMFLYSGILFSIVMSSIPVYATRILELTEVGIIFIAVNKKYGNFYSYGCAFFTLILIFHKILAYLFVNPLLNY
ncbi:EpsG family protein [Pedobacter aquatilis]|uniref:EpsG family protein n=1 Tax=Pedobacter aquatilis TaxID=351343 RepID=UPI0025B425B1|nr:EpsG family protein [Pedobacter aquatilis]MDN3587282.1 EpsG family protein [Pedobacter aquatilis]